MKDFYLTTSVAVVIITSLASNLLWVMAFGPAAPGLGTRLRSALGETVSGLRYPLDAWVAGLIARRERQAATSGLEDLADRARLGGSSDEGEEREENGTKHATSSGEGLGTTVLSPARLLDQCNARRSRGVRSLDERTSRSSHGWGVV